MSNSEPRFDGVKWRCAKCQSVLATVAQVEELQLPTRKPKGRNLIKFSSTPKAAAVHQIRFLTVQRGGSLPTVPLL